MTITKIKRIATSVGKTIVSIGIWVINTYAEESARKQKEDEKYRRHMDTRRRNKHY